MNLNKGVLIGMLKEIQHPNIQHVLSYIAYSSESDSDSYEQYLYELADGSEPMRVWLNILEERNISVAEANSILCPPYKGIRRGDRYINPVVEATETTSRIKKEILTIGIKLRCQYKIPRNEWYPFLNQHFIKDMQGLGYPIEVDRNGRARSQNLIVKGPEPEGPQNIIQLIFSPDPKGIPK